MDNDDFNQNVRLRRLIWVYAERIVSISRKHTYIILTPLKPHFYKVKVGFSGVYIILLKI